MRNDHPSLFALSEAQRTFDLYLKHGEPAKNAVMYQVGFLAAVCGVLFKGGKIEYERDRMIRIIGSIQAPMHVRKDKFEVWFREHLNNMNRYIMEELENA